MSKLSKVEKAERHARMIEHAQNQTYWDLPLISTEILTRLYIRHARAPDVFGKRLVQAIEVEMRARGKAGELGLPSLAPVR